MGTVDKDDVVVVTHRLDCILELPLTIHGRHEFDLCAGEIEARRRNEQVLHGDRLDCVFSGTSCKRTSYNEWSSWRVQAEPGAGVGLWIQVDNQNPTPQLGKACAQIDGRRRLPNTTLWLATAKRGDRMAEQDLAFSQTVVTSGSPSDRRLSSSRSLPCVARTSPINSRQRDVVSCGTPSAGFALPSLAASLG